MPDDINRIKCLRCDNQILEATARYNSGLCGVCNRHQKRADFDAVVQSWVDNPETLPGTNGIPEPEGIALSIAARQLKSQLYPDAEDMMAIVCQGFFDVAHSKWEEFGSSDLSEREKYVLAIETFYGEVTNGGLLQYLGNESGSFAEWAVDAFDAVGIPAYANVMRNVKTLFRDGIIPEDADERWAQVEAIDDQRLTVAEQPFWDRYFADKMEIRRSLFRFLRG